MQKVMTTTRQGVTQATRRAARLGALAAGLVLLLGAGSCSSTIVTRASTTADGRPDFGKCLSGKSLEKFTSCGEYCASEQLGCQQFGCTSSADPSKRFGAVAHGDGMCTGKPTRSFQCNDPIDPADAAVRCCCVAQQ